MKGVLIGGVLIVITGLFGIVQSTAVASSRSSANCIDCAESVELLQDQSYPCLQVIEVPVGGTLPMRLVSNGKVVAIGDEIAPWYGDYVNGVYHAPNELTPGGLDTILLSRANGVPYAKVVIQLVPIGGFVPLNRVMSPVSTEAMTEEELAAWESSYDTSTSAYEILQPAEESVLAIGQLAGLTGQFAPMMKADPDGPEEFGPTDALVLGSSTVKKGKKCGVFPKPTGSFSNGAVKKIVGKWKVHKKPPVMPITLNFGVAPLTVRITYLKMRAWKVRYTDYYRFESNQWKYVRTEKCTQGGAYASGFDPTNTPFAINNSTVTRIALGYDVNGFKFDTGLDCQTEP